MVQAALTGREKQLRNLQEEKAKQQVRYHHWLLLTASGNKNTSQYLIKLYLNCTSLCDLCELSYCLLSLCHHLYINSPPLNNEYVLYLPYLTYHNNYNCKLFKCSLKMKITFSFLLKVKPSLFIAETDLSI